MKKKIDYSKEKIHISIDKKILDILEEIINYPQWKGNRSLFIETAVSEFIAGNIAKESKCIFCNKTECTWTILDRKVGKGVCSECSFDKMQVVDNGKRETKE